MFQKLCLPV